MIDLAVLEVFGWGCLGAVFPEVKRQYEIRGQGAGEPVRYYIWTVLFVIGSGLVVIALPGHLAPLTAIYAGFAAPVIVSKGGESLAKSLGKSQGSSGTRDADAGDLVDEVTGETRDEVFVEVKGKIVRQNGWQRFALSL